MVPFVPDNSTFYGNYQNCRYPLIKSGHPFVYHFRNCYYFLLNLLFETSRDRYCTNHLRLLLYISLFRTAHS